MRAWSLPLDAPLTLTLATDSGSADFNPDDDQIWQLRLSDSDPKGLELHTTFGLRAKSMRVLPAFELEGELRHDLDTFAAPPLVHTWLPAYISLSFYPYKKLHVMAEYWARSSSLIAGRYTVRNLGEGAIQSGLRLYGILMSGENAQPIRTEIENGVQILSGRTDDLHPVIFLEGGAKREPAAYPALGVHTILEPDQTHSWIWAQSAEPSLAQGFKNCRVMMATNWDAEVARVLMQGSHLVDVQTGNPDWDAAFWAAQREAEMLFVRPSLRYKNAFPIKSRNVKDGNSAWEPADPWESYYLALQILPASPEYVKGYLQVVLRAQGAEGHIPALLDFRSAREGWLHPPILAQLAARFYKRTEDLDLLKTAFPALLTFFERWFDEAHDRDADGFPEWDHVNQAGYKSWPAFSPWYEWTNGLDIKTAETIDLASLLILEGASLVEIALAIEQLDAVESVQKRVHLLRDRIEQSWSKAGGYKHVDYYLHESVPGRRLGVRRGSFTLKINREYDPAVRVLLQVEGPEDRARGLIVRIHSRGRRGPGRVEQYDFKHFDWFLNCGYLTSDKPSAEISKIELEGIDRKFKTTVSLADYSRDDITLLMPLAAGVPSEGRAGVLLDRFIMNPDRFWRAGGLPSIPADDPGYQETNGKDSASINMLRNHWVAEGMLRYGFQNEAGELLRRLLGSVIHTLKSEHAFYSGYNPDVDQIMRSNGPAGGLTPLSLLLDILGVELVTARKLYIKPGNPLGMPVSFTWLGLQITCNSNETVVSFPDGEVVEISGDARQLVQQIELE
jgi:hypothetical protein